MRDSGHLQEKSLQEKKMQEERMQEVLLLLEHLVSHEEITIKLIIDCLLDVGSVNLINRKFQRSPLNRPLKQIAGVSKPILKLIAFRWFKRNCPELIVNWLYLKVSFPELVEPPLPAPPEAVAAAPPPLVNSENLNLAVNSDNLSLEIQRLRGQVKLLSGITIGAVAALSGVLVWINQRPAIESSQQPIQPVQPVDANTANTSESRLQIRP